MGKTFVSDVDYLTLPGALTLAEKIKDFWKCRDIIVRVAVNCIRRGSGFGTDIYTLSSDIVHQKGWQTTYIDLPVKYMGRFHMVQA